jgi:hypothetical protein
VPAYFCSGILHELEKSGKFYFDLTMASVASARFASVSTEQIGKIVQDKDSEDLKILNNKRMNN